MDSIGIRVKQLRNERRMKQTELAALLGVKQTTLSTLETDKRRFDASMIRKLSCVFGVTSDWLLGLSDERTESSSNRYVAEKMQKAGSVCYELLGILQDASFRSQDKEGAE